jgi:8-oxo-dGTP pyrophosphatase MutT (NUDIX family)
VARTGSENAGDRVEVAAGGVVWRLGPSGPEVAIAEQRDRNRGDRTVRLPKGKAEIGESLEETAVREVREETGLGAEIVQPLREVRYRYFEAREGQHVDKRVHFYLMRHTGGVPAPRDGEMERVYWVPLERASRELTFETERAVVAEARALLVKNGG